jgi:capsid protein
MGIERDEFGRAGRLPRPHGEPGRYARRAASVYERVPAYDANGLPQMLHVYEQLLPDQSRGFPWLAPVMSLLKDHQGLCRDGARHGAGRRLLWRVRHAARCDPDESGRRRRPTARTTDGDRYEEVEPGRIHLPEAETKRSTSGHSEPAGQHGSLPFMEWVLRRIAAGLNYPYELLAKNWTGLSYSSGRLSLLDARITFGCRQQILIERFLQPLWRWLVVFAEMVGRARRFACRPAATSTSTSSRRARGSLPAGRGSIRKKDIAATSTPSTTCLKRDASVLAENGLDSGRGARSARL